MENHQQCKDVEYRVNRNMNINERRRIIRNQPSTSHTEMSVSKAGDAEAASEAVYVKGESQTQSDIPFLVQVHVHRQGFEHYRRSLLKDIANAEARVEAAAAAKAARRAKERADRVGKHTRRGAQAQLAHLTVSDVGTKSQAGVKVDEAQAGRKEAVASVFGKKKRKN